MVKKLVGVWLGGLLCFTAIAKQSLPKNRDSVLKVMNKVAQWQMNEWKEGRIIKLPKTEWENGALYTGFVTINFYMILEKN